MNTLTALLGFFAGANLTPGTEGRDLLVVVMIVVFGAILLGLGFALESATRAKPKRRPLQLELDLSDDSKGAP